MAWNDHVCREEYVNRAADCFPSGNDLGIYGIKAGVEELNVSLDGGTVGR
jgi:hypothetical protein